MRPRFRIILLLTLCLALLSSGCSLLEKQKLPFQRQDEVTLWANSIAGLPGVEQGRRAEMVWKNPSSSQALKLRALSIAASRPGRQGYPARKELAALYARATAEQRAAWETMYWTDLDGMDSDTLKKLAASVSSEQEQSFPWNLVMLKAARRGLLTDSSAVLSRLSNPMLYAAPAMLGLGEAPAATPSSTISVALVIPQKPATPVRDDRAERFVEHLGTILERTRAKASLTKSFFNWKCRARRQVVVLGSENGKLLEQAQECITRIAVLETELDQTRREKREIAAALEDSVKNETKMAAVAQRLNQEKDALERSLKASERKYEEDVLQFILETKFNSDSRISRAVNLEAEIRKLQLERNSLQEFIRESQDEHKRQIDALNAKLQSAFDVASGFRREISKLKSASIDSSPPPYSPPSVGSARASGYALGNF